MIPSHDLDLNNSSGTIACANSNLTPIELVRHLPPKKVLLKRCSKHCTAEKWNLIIKSKWRCRDQKSLVWNWYIKEAQVLICSVSPDLVLRCCTHGLFSQYLLLSPRAWKCWGFKRNLVFGLLPFWFSSLCTSGTALSNLAAVLRNGVPISSFLSTAGPQTPKPKLHTWFTCCFLLKSVLIYGFNQATVSQPHSVSLSINTVLARKKKKWNDSIKWFYYIKLKNEQCKYRCCKRQFPFIFIQAHWDNVGGRTMVCA